MKKTLILLISFALFGSVTAWYLLTQQDDKTTLLAKDQRFSIEDSENIYKIFIASKKGEKTTLERKENYWLYNGEYKARPNAIENLLDAITRVQVKYKPPTAAVDNMVKDLATNGLKVELYNNNNKLLKTYYVGGSTADERGTYMIMEGSNQPYVTYIPSWEGNIRFRYNLTGEDWRDKTIFTYKQDDIQSVSIEYPKQRNQSFRLERSGNGFEIKPFYETTPIVNQPISEGKVEAFLEGFKSLGAEAFENENPRRDSILKLMPFSIIKISSKDGDSTTVRLFPIIPEYDPAVTRLPNADAVERYFLDWNGQDFMLIQHRVFSKILWGYDFFFEKK
ncbi:MAG: DUF4340 domain-containing protein [Saprospiraceae bacterium]|nr:DUF4340 domain-containing protein [Saprospiraceae bacterium]